MHLGFWGCHLTSLKPEPKCKTWKKLADVLFDLGIRIVEDEIHSSSVCILCIKSQKCSHDRQKGQNHLQGKVTSHSRECLIHHTLHRQGKKYFLSIMHPQSNNAREHHHNSLWPGDVVTTPTDKEICHLNLDLAWMHMKISLDHLYQVIWWLNEKARPKNCNAVSHNHVRS